MSSPIYPQQLQFGGFSPAHPPPAATPQAMLQGAPAAALPAAPAENLNWAFSFDATGIEPTHVARELFEEGGYAAKIIKMVDVAKISDPTQRQIRVDLVVTEPGFEGRDTAIYLQYPRTPSQGMSDKEAQAARLSLQNLVALYRSVGYAPQQITGTLTVKAEFFVGRLAAFHVNHKEEVATDRYGNPQIEDGQPRMRINERRNFCTPEDYAKTSVSRRLVLKSGAAPAAASPAFPAVPAVPGQGNGVPGAMGLPGTGPGALAGILGQPRF